MNAGKSQGQKRLYEFGEFRLDPSERVLAVHGKRIPLPPRAFDTLLILVQNRGHVLTKDELMGAIWPDTFVEENNLTQQISALRRAFGSEQHYIETVPKMGYRFNSEVREVHETTPGSKAGPEEPDPAAPRAAPEPGWRKKPLILAAAAGLAIVAVALSRLWSPARARASPHSASTLAVLPLRNLRPGPDTDFLGLALTDAIINRLGYASALQIEPLSAVSRYRGTDLDARRIARELNVQDVLTGSYVREGDELRVTTELIRVGADSGLWRDNIELKYDRLMSVQDRVAISVIHSLGLELRPEEAERLNRGVPTNPEAYECYLRGIDEGFRSNFKGAIDILERSVALEPGDAMAWSELATAYMGYGNIQGGGAASVEKGWQAFEHARGCDPENRLIPDLMAFYLLESNRAPESVRLLRESIRRNPNDSFAHWYLSEAYRYGGALEESVAEGELALRLNPNVARNLTFNTYLYLGLYRKFLESLPRAEDNARTTFYRGLAYCYLKDSRRAAEEFDRAYAMNSALSHARVGRAFACALRDQNAQGIRLMRDVEKSAGEDGEMLYKMAQAYAQLGDRASALRVLRRAIELNFCPYAYFLRDPMLEPVRGEPGYRAAMELARRHQQAFLSRTTAG